MVKKFLAALTLLLVGAVLGWQVAPLFSSAGSETSSNDEPLYWVAPMDPDYRRDSPGKSPMGMDLVPVYEESSADDSPGLVRINPDVENNLGVRTALVKEGPLSMTLTASGIVQFNEEAIQHIHPRVEGWVEKLHVKAVGNPVEKNQPLYDLYSPQLVNAQEEFLLALKSNNASLLEASLDNLRALNFPQATIQALRKDKTVKQTVTFRAPQSGVLENLQIREGYFVGPSKTLMSIVNLDKVWVEAEVFQSQLHWLKQGLAVSVKLHGFDDKLNGQVDYIYPKLNMQNRTGRVRIVLENPQKKLKAGMYANVEFATQTIQNVAYVPKEAVIRLGDASRVVKHVADGQYKSIAVKTGVSNEQYIAIPQGLKPGERIVTSAQFLIDSESSKASDYKRIDRGAATRLPNASVMGTVNEVDAENSIINISRSAIEKWNRPAATMDFVLDPSLPNKLINGLHKDQSIHFTFVIDDGEFYVTEIHPMEKTLADHDNMNHSDMDHSSMKDDATDHEELNHEGMNHD